jgi:hypothetical protein
VLALLVGATLLLLGLRIPVSSISGFAESRFVSLALKQRIVTSDLTARNLGVSFVGDLRLPDGSVLPDQDVSLLIEDASALPDSFSSVPGFEVSENALIVATLARPEQRVQLRFSGAPIEFIILPGQGAHLEVDAADCHEAASCVFAVDTTDALMVTARPEQPLILQFDIPSHDAPLATRVLVSSISFWETDVQHGSVEKNSGLLGGRVRFIERPDAARDFDRGEIVTLEPSSLTIRDIQIEGGLLYTQFSGSVDSLTVDIGEEEHSLMPTWFDALSNNVYVRFLLGLMSLIVGVDIYLRASRRAGSK